MLEIIVAIFRSRLDTAHRTRVSANRLSLTSLAGGPAVRSPRISAGPAADRTRGRDAAAAVARRRALGAHRPRAAQSAVQGVLSRRVLERLASESAISICQLRGQAARCTLAAVDTFPKPLFWLYRSATVCAEYLYIALLCAATPLVGPQAKQAGGCSSACNQSGFPLE